MSEALPQPMQDAAAQLADWRREGLWRVDPVRFGFLQALAARLAGQPEAVRLRLQTRLQAGLADYALCLSQARAQAGEEARALAQRQPALARQARGLQARLDLRGLRRLAAQAVPSGGAALAQLTEAADRLSPTLREGAALAVPGREELSSVRRFRQVWARGRSQDQLAQARARQPINAGPLNSHALVLQSLALMQELSDDYLRHFLAHVQSLQWLESLRDAPVPASARPAQRHRSKK
jgi:hypothetical protein